MKNKRRVALLTGGGDAPGLNGIIESFSTILLNQGFELIGVMDGFEGIFDRKTRDIKLEDLHGLHAQAGTFLGTSNKSKIDGREKEFLDKFKELNVEGLVAAGGDGTFAAIKRLGAQIPLIGVPKTIDNDLQGTEVTFGYDTACSVVSEAADAIRATAEAHRRIMIIETMGRTAGWIALGGGLSGYADVILVPERPFSKSALKEFILKKHAQGKRGLVIVASEAAHPEGEDAQVALVVKDSPQAERYGGIAQMLARWVEKETGWEGRHIVLGHLQRARAPTTTDRFLTMTMGAEAAQMVIDKAWNQAVVMRGGHLKRVPLQDLQGPAREIPKDHEWVRLAQNMGIFI